MKKFNHGDWFSLYKMTKEQQQWCLDNLDWMSDVGKDQCVRDKAAVAYYFESKGCFGSASWLSRTYPSRELTFKDLYYKKEETKPMDLEKYAIEDLRRIRDNIDGLLTVVDEINSQTEAQESGESVRGFEGLELTTLGKRMFHDYDLQKRSLFFKRSHSESQEKYLYMVFPRLLPVAENGQIGAIFLLKSGYKAYHFNDLFQYKTEL